MLLSEQHKEQTYVDLRITSDMSMSENQADECNM